VGHEEEKEGIGRNVEIEIDKAVDEKTRASRQTGE
jgi:hypothetical protein